MQLPIVAEGKCLNHPTVKAVKLHLCTSCLAAWEKSKEDYQAWSDGVQAEANDKEMEDNSR